LLFRTLIGTYFKDMKQPLEGSELKGALNGWIDLKGNFYALGFAQHNEFAYEVLNKMVNKKDPIEQLTAVRNLCEQYKVSYVYEVLVELGWLRVVCWTGVFVTIDCKKNIVNRVKRTFDEWLLWNPNIELNYI